jgi:hypothetical protein
LNPAVRTWRSLGRSERSAVTQACQHLVLSLAPEFQVIANITMLQSACKTYYFPRHEFFVDWFEDMELFTVDER